MYVYPLWLLVFCHTLVGILVSPLLRVLVSVTFFGEICIFIFCITYYNICRHHLRLRRTGGRDSISPMSYWRPRKRKHLMLT